MRTWILSLILATSSASFAAQDMVLVVGDRFDRLYMIDDAGAASGLSADILQAIARKTGDTIQFKVYPWSRALALVEHGKADIVSGMYKTTERETRFLFCDNPYYQDQIKFYARTDRKLVWNGDLASLKDKRIAVIRGWYSGAKFEQSQNLLQLNTSDNMDNALKLLQRGMIDIILSNERMVDHLATGKAGPVIAALEPAVDVQYGYLAFRKDTPGKERRNKYCRVLDEMTENGELEKILHTYNLSMPPHRPGRTGKN